MMEIDQENNNSLRNTSNQQRKLAYRNLLDRLEDIEENEDLNNLRKVEELGEILRSANELNNTCDITERVTNADETLLDANVLAGASSLLVQCLETDDIFTSTYDATEFCAKLIEIIRDPENEDFKTEDFLKLLDVARDVIPEVPSYYFLHGTYDFTKLPQPVERKQREREVVEKVEKKQLKQITNIEKNEDVSLKKINFIEKVLLKEYRENDGQPINYYDFVVDSDDFTSTVENIFYCSFLFCDGKAKLDVDDNDTVTLAPVNEKVLKQFKEMNMVNTQMVTSITMDEWQKLKVTEGILQRHKKRFEK